MQVGSDPVSPPSAIVSSAVTALETVADGGDTGALPTCSAQQ